MVKDSHNFRHVGRPSSNIDFPNNHILTQFKTIKAGGAARDRYAGNNMAIQLLTNPSKSSYKV